MANIPEGANPEVARIVIAWEIVNQVITKIDRENFSADQSIDEYTRLFRKAFNQLYHEPEGKGR